MDKVDCIVIGAGVIGLAVVRALVLKGREVLVLEAHRAIGMETSSRNSEVIHAGLYYPTNSLKAKFCVSGRERLYTYCKERCIPHRRCGKLIVATSQAQQEKLAAIHAQAHANGCNEVIALTAHEAKKLEPDLSCVAAVLSPMTGIIDSHAYMEALQADAQNAGAVFAFNSCVLGGEHTAEGIVLRVQAVKEEVELQARTIFNCGGLWAPQIARQIAGLDKGTIPNAYFAKGNYYSLVGKAPFSHLVYPIPTVGGLGVHFTLDLAGQGRFGPDVEWLNGIESENDIDYTVDLQRADGFYSVIRTYWPNLRDWALYPAYAGVRPKISSSQEPAADFLVASHGSVHYVGLYGIESPGLTASMAIAEYVSAARYQNKLTG